MLIKKRGYVNKKAWVLIWETLFTLIIIVLILGASLYFLNINASGKLIRKQVLAKEICVLTTMFRPDTSIMIEYEKGRGRDGDELFIERNKEEVVIKSSKYDMGYRYPCYSKSSFEKEGGKTKIETA